MKLSPVLILLAAALAGCSGAQLRDFGGNLVGSAVNLFAGNDNALEPLPGGNHCDALCEQDRQLRSNRLADEYYRLQAQERKEQTEEAFEAFMNDLRGRDGMPVDDLPVVIVDHSH